jgi:hypothetical protein
MRYEQAVDVAAPPFVPWSILLDVTRWPEWTSSVRSVERLDAGEIAIGSRTRIKQPALRPAVWIVTELTEPTSAAPGRFVWVSTTPGMEITAVHTVSAVGDTASRVLLGIEQRGFLAAVLGPLYAARIRRYLATEAAGLAARSLERV